MKHPAGGNGGNASASDEESAECQGVVLSDNNFDIVPYGVKASGPHYRFTDGKLTVLPRKNDVESYFWAVGNVRTFDACVTASFVKGSGNFVALGVQQGAKGPWLALALWFNGTAEVQKYDPAARTLTSPVPAESGAAAGLSDGKAFHLAMKIRGNSAAFYINGRKFASVPGAVPQGALIVLLQGGSAGGGTSTWAFDDLLITDGSALPGGPSAAALVQEGCTGEVLKSENFDEKKVPENWQNLDPGFAVTDGHFAMTSAKRGSIDNFIWVDISGQADPSQHDVDLCASTSWSRGRDCLAVLCSKTARMRTRSPSRSAMTAPPRWPITT